MWSPRASRQTLQTQEFTTQLEMDNNCPSILLLGHVKLTVCFDSACALQGVSVFVLWPSKIICVFQVNFFPKMYERGLKQNTNLKKYTRLIQWNIIKTQHFINEHPGAYKYLGTGHHTQLFPLCVFCFRTRAYKSKKKLESKHTFNFMRPYHH